MYTSTCSALHFPSFAENLIVCLERSLSSNDFAVALDESFKNLGGTWERHHRTITRGVIAPFFHWSGNWPDWRERLKMCVSGPAKAAAQSTTEFFVFQQSFY